MKNLISLLFLTFSHIAFAQVPQGIPYQAAARNASGQPLVNTAVKVRFSIIDSVATGTTVYQETHSVTTNNVGLFNVNVGLGTPVTGTFSGINWGQNFKFMKVELDPSGAGSNYVDMGTQQMMSVPYALYSATSGKRFIAGNGINIRGDTIQSVQTNIASGIGVNLTGKTNLGFAGSTTWTCPSNITQIFVQLWGGCGGAGALGEWILSNGSYSFSCGGSGGIGGYNSAIITVTPGVTYNIHIGQGGQGGGRANGIVWQNSTSGDSSSFGGNLLIARGGGGGANGNNLFSGQLGTNGIDGQSAQIVNFYPSNISSAWSTSLSSTRSYIPTGYVVTLLTPSIPSSSKSAFYNNGSCSTVYSSWCPQCGAFSDNGESGYCVISY